MSGFDADKLNVAFFPTASEGQSSLQLGYGDAKSFTT